MSTSPISELTILLWGDRWWLPGRSEPLEFQNDSHAVEILAAHLVEEGRRVAVRLIYQPLSLASVPVTCPAGNRATLKAAFEFEYPAVDDPRHAWSYEPVLPLAEGHSTILHFEQEPRLFELVSVLGQRGVDVVAAWPLATFLHGLPGDWSESGAVAVLAVANDCALAYHHPAEGNREVKAWLGENAAAQALSWFAALPASADSKLLVTAGECEPAAERASLVRSIDAALATPVVLPRRHPAQLIPPAVASTAAIAMLVAGLLLVLTGSWGVARHAQRYYDGWTRQRTDAVEIGRLTAEIQHLRENAAEIHRLRGQTAGTGPNPPLADFLETLGEKLPGGVALGSVRMTGARFTVAGHVANDAEPKLPAWRDALADKRWQLDPALPPHGGAFQIEGRFAQ